jgi:hypothetical protein
MNADIQRRNKRTKGTLTRIALIFANFGNGTRNAKGAINEQHPSIGKTPNSNIQASNIYRRERRELRMKTKLVDCPSSPRPSPPGEGERVEPFRKIRGGGCISSRRQLENSKGGTFNI